VGGLRGPILLFSIEKIILWTLNIDVTQSKVLLDPLLREKKLTLVFLGTPKKSFKGPFFESLLEML
jgi:hypothetical protein